MTTREAAAALGVSVRRVQAAIKAGRIKAEKIGRDWDVDIESVEAYAVSAARKHRPRKTLTCMGDLVYKRDGHKEGAGC